MNRALLLSTSLLAIAASPTPLSAQSTLADPPKQTAVPAPPAEAAAAARADGAQPDRPTSGPAAASTGDIVVTGSRITRNGYQAPTPVSVFGAGELRQQAVTRLVDVSRILPAFKNQGGARSGTNSSGNQGQGGLDLRGLGRNRNLILLDRRRIVPSTGNGVVDINIIPNALIQRVDVVTGGASAAWGSDAVSGVVNFVLDTRFTGIRGELQGGISSHGDDREGSVAFAAGTGFAGGRGRIVASAEYYDGGAQRLVDRAFLAKKPGLVFNPGYTATNGQPQYVVAPEGVVTSYMTHGGIVDGCRNATGGNIANCSLRGIAFGPGGTPYQFQYGTYVNPTGNMIAPPGSDYLNYYTSLYDGIQMVNPSNHLSLFSHAEYDVAGEAATIYLEGIYSRAKIGPSFSVPPYRFGTSSTTWLSVTADNPYLPASVRAQMSGPGGGNAAGPYALNVGRINDDWIPGNSETNNVNKTYRAVVGAKGKFGGGWGYDVWYEYGRNRYYATLDNNLIVANVNRAADVVAAPAGNALGVAAGTPVCRSSLTAPTNGCHPLNIFGVGAASAAAVGYVLGRQSSLSIYEQHAAEASIHGNPFSTWAGPVSIAAGVSYRAENIVATSDALSRQFAFGVGNPQPYSGSYDVKEVFGEVVVPLAKDVRFLESLELTAAGRYTNYSTSGGVGTWKVGGTWQPVKSVRFRVTRSHDIRAPSLQELFTGAVQNRASVVDNTLATPVALNVQQYVGGNTNLVPEKAETFSGGVVLQPTFAPGLSMSVDYYNIDIRGAITTLGAQDTVDRCAGGNQALCALLIRSGPTLIGVNLPFLNLASLRTRGVDIEAGYRLALSSIAKSLPGNLSIRALANYVDSFTFSDGISTREIAGELQAPTGSLVQQPRWTAQSFVTFDDGPFRATLTNRFISAGVIDNRYRGVPNAITDNHVASRLYTGLSFAYSLEKVRGKPELSFNVDNLFDVKPPRGFGWGYGLNASPVYDIIGPFFKLGVRTRF